MHCPNCGQSTQPGQSRCGHCNYKLPETALPKASADTGKINCWNCSQENDRHSPRCLQCNTKLDQPAPSRRQQPQGAITFTPNTASHDE